MILTVWRGKVINGLYVFELLHFYKFSVFTAERMNVKQTIPNTNSFSPSVLQTHLVEETAKESQKFQRGKTCNKYRSALLFEEEQVRYTYEQICASLEDLKAVSSLKQRKSVVFKH